jgi:hypothetical protein
MADLAKQVRLCSLSASATLVACLAPAVAIAGPPKLPPPPGGSAPATLEAEPADAASDAASVQPAVEPAPANPVSTGVGGPSGRVDGLELQRPRGPVREIAPVAPPPQDLRPTSSPAPPSRPLPPRVRVPASTTSRAGQLAVASADEAEPSREPLAHRGLILDVATGILGCTRAVCAGSGGHDAVPGVFVGGFLGGNIGGFVELGVRGGWGQLRSRARDGEHPTSYWGVAPSHLSDELVAYGGAIDIPVVDRLTQARSQAVQLSAFNVAPALRIHFVPRGRAIAFAGAGAGYGGLRSDHRTDLGPLQLSAHGITVPVEAGLGVHITKNLAMIARFDYAWMHYLLLSFDDASDVMVVPTSMLDRVAPRQNGQDAMQERLPHFWTVTLGVRLRLF